MKSYQKLIVLLLLGICFFSLESFIKYFLILNKVPKQGFYFFNLLQISFSPNQNIAFSLPLPQIISITLVIIILILLGFLWWVNLVGKKIWELTAISFIILGAISNLLDRLLFGFVIDYINIFIWPVFNLADVMIVGGIFIYILSEFKKPKVKTLTI